MTSNNFALVNLNVFFQFTLSQGMVGICLDFIKKHQWYQIH